MNELITIPAAKAPNIGISVSIIGKFQVPIIKTTPYGCFCMRALSIKLTSGFCTFRIKNVKLRCNLIGCTINHRPNIYYSTRIHYTFGNF